MNFDAMNKMLDELNANLSIVETETKKLEQQKFENDKALFWEVHKYFANWASLFEKARRKGESFTVCFDAIGEGRKTFELEFCESCRPQLLIPPHSLTAALFEYNELWFDSTYFCNGYFKGVMANIRKIDYDLVERQLVEELNKRITRKAEYIEQRYQEAANAM